ncbi:MAG: hypothetical protein D6714_05295 [Bacteroidetes bacterium]|nr:MAG: hypothetical protein D6714_05295 [Bacteroidota bacterium]
MGERKRKNHVRVSFYFSQKLFVQYNGILCECQAPDPLGVFLFCFGRKKNSGFLPRHCFLMRIHLNGFAQQG